MSRTFCEQTLFEQFWIVKTLVDLLFGIASDAEETAIFVHFQRFKVSLQIGYYDLVTPGRGGVVRMLMFGIPLLVPLSLNFPLCCFDGTACDERWNFIVFNTYRGVMTSLDSRAFDAYILCPMMSLRCVA